jgi:hypothetical protein
MPWIRFECYLTFLQATGIYPSVRQALNMWHREKSDVSSHAARKEV